MQTFSKILSILTLHEKKRAILLLILILCTAFVDVLGVASVMPFVALLTNPNMIVTNSTLKHIYNISNNFGIISIQQFMFAFGIGVFFLILFSISIRALSQYAQVRFALMREYTIGKRLIENYLHQPYSWFLNRNSSVLGSKILSEVGKLVSLAIVPFFQLVNSLIAIIFLIFLLLLVNYKITMIII